jgi:hypothetical protein
MANFRPYAQKPETAGFSKSLLRIYQSKRLCVPKDCENFTPNMKENFVVLWEMPPPPFHLSLIDSDTDFLVAGF